MDVVVVVVLTLTHGYNAVRRGQDVRMCGRVDDACMYIPGTNMYSLHPRL